VEHAILTCQYVSDVWHEIKRCFGLTLNIKYLVCMKQWLFDFLDDASDNQKTTVTITVWHIWEARNAVRNGESRVHPKVIAEKAIAYTQMSLLHISKIPISHRCI